MIYSCVVKITLLIIGIILTCPATADDIELLPDVASDFEQLIERQDVRAVAIGLYESGQTRFVGMGKIGSDNSSQPTGNTVFEIGSISKVFTSLLTQVQIGAGNLDWNSPISAYLANVDFANDQVAAITLLELATHTSGLPRLPDNMTFDDPTDPYAGYKRDHLMAFLGSYDPDSLEKKYGYSNLGAGLLGVIAADASGTDYAKAMSKDVLMPLGLVDTEVGLREDFTSRLAIGFSSGADMPNWDGFDALAGAGALVSTVHDLLRFIELSLEGEALDGAIKSIQTSRGDGTTGLGWHLQNTDAGGTIVWHNGGTGGYASFLAIRPDNSTGVVVLATSTEYGRVTELGFEQISGKTSMQRDIDLSPYAGAYKLDENFVLTVFIEDSELHGQATGQGAFPLTFESNDRFSFASADIMVTFERAADGTVDGLVLRQAGNDTPAQRVDESLGIEQRSVIAVDAEKLTDFVGRYQLAPTAIITVESRGSQLYAALTGQPSYPVFAYEPDRFFYKVVDAQLHFERDDDGKIVAVVLHQMGQQRAPRIE